MSRQKYLQMVVTLAVLSMPFSANAADAPINAGAGTTVTVGDNYEIEMTGKVLQLLQQLRMQTLRWVMMQK